VGVPLLCFYLDGLDRDRAFTLGYGCHCVKPREVGNICEDAVAGAKGALPHRGLDRAIS
jgi:hypothetical protein